MTEENVNAEMIDKKYIINKYGLSEYQAKRIVTQSKKVAVHNNLTYYDNRRIGKVPHYIVRHILGLDEEQLVEIVRADDKRFLNKK